MQTEKFIFHLQSILKFQPERHYKEDILSDVQIPKAKVSFIPAYIRNYT